MRVCLAAIGALAAIVSSTAALAGCPGDCQPPVFVYPSGPGIYPVPPSGYLDPFAARRDFYIVNQGPMYDGPAIMRVPTYAEGGYAIAQPYPHIHAHSGSRYGHPWFDRP